MKQLDLRVQNMDCEHDASRLKRALEGRPDVRIVRILPAAAKVRVEVDEAQLSEEQLEMTLAEAGFPVAKQPSDSGPPPFLKNPKVLSSGASGILLLAGWLLASAGLSTEVATGIYLFAVVIGGYYFGREALEELLFERQIGIELLMSVAAVAAFSLGQPAEAAMLVFLYSISEALEGYTEAKTRSAVRALMDLTPKFALLLRDGKEVEIPVEDIKPGDRFLVKPGQSVPTDGEIVTGHSSLNEASVTGESVPVEKTSGETVYAGSINGEGSLEVTATKAFFENTISRIIQMVEEAQERKGVSQQFIERFGVWYSPAVLAVAVGIALLGPILFAGGWTEWLIRATVFIVAGAPCALVISIPVTLVAALGTGARQGVLIKGGIYVERLAKISVVALDKTGTITRGEPEVTDLIVTEGSEFTPSEDYVLSIAAGIERLSQHPLAEAIVRFVEGKGVAPARVSDFRSLTGAGASAKVDGRTVYIGSPDFFTNRLGLDARPLGSEITKLQDEGKTAVLIGEKGSLWAIFGIRDTIRDNARDAIESLRLDGVRVVMLTGDNERTAKAIAQDVGIEEFHAHLKPEDKVAKVRFLEDQYGRVAMVGDGVNDAPALAEASVGIAMGAAGTDVALETADVALMADDLQKLVYALKLARRNQRIVRQNLALSAVVVSVLVVGAVFGSFTLPVAVLGHEISEFLVIGNGLRMLRA